MRAALGTSGCFCKEKQGFWLINQCRLPLHRGTAFVFRHLLRHRILISSERSYDRFGLSILVNNKPLDRDAEFRKMQQDIRFAAADVEMDTDGSVANSKADLRKVPKGSLDMMTDVSEQILQTAELMAIPLPSKKIEVQDTWKAQRTLMIGSAIVAVPVQADITYKYLGVQTLDGKDGALIWIEGRVKGRKGDGLDVSGTVTGTAFVSVETGQLISGDTTIKADVDLTFQRKQSKAIATLSVSMNSMNRPAPVVPPK